MPISRGAERVGMVVARNDEAERFIKLPQSLINGGEVAQLIEDQLIRGPACPPAGPCLLALAAFRQRTLQDGLSLRRILRARLAFDSNAGVQILAAIGVRERPVHRLVGKVKAIRLVMLLLDKLQPVAIEQIGHVP
jgi:hypothetical protein